MCCYQQIKNVPGKKNALCNLLRPEINCSVASLLSCACGFGRCGPHPGSATYERVISLVKNVIVTTKVLINKFDLNEEKTEEILCLQWNLNNK
ncbi:hypothetical protein SAMN05660826_01476 [Caldanaerovirga acetigignens]|uniref:Uncharacterized protein n=1 Tax=Caldanaerovirga acetigignens TaxID=447595 RepID=A0A1M7KAK3_9FIRM|nr:hypothetical protein SAMN05660826_01476 [Caldanaerovirga acetigignens]